MWTNIVLTVLDIFGVWRWLVADAGGGRGSRGSEASEQTPARPCFRSRSCPARQSSGRSELARASMRWRAVRAAVFLFGRVGRRSGGGRRDSRRAAVERRERGGGERDCSRWSEGVPSAEGTAARPVAGALIITAEIGASDLAWLDRLRRAHYPAERNQLPAHLTMFRALPPSAEGEARSTLSRLAAEAAPCASIEGLMDLGGGVAFRVVSHDLDRIRRELADRFHGLLSAQTPPDGGRTSPSRTRSLRRTRGHCLAGLRPISARIRSRSVDWDCIGIAAGRGRGLLRAVPRILGKLADPVAAEVECGKSRFKHGGEHRLFHQLIDRAWGPGTHQVLSFAHRLVPVAGFVGSLTDPAERDDFRELILAEVLEYRFELFLDAVVDVVLENDSAPSCSSSTLSGSSPGS